MEYRKKHFEEKIAPLMNENIEIEAFEPRMGKYIFRNTKHGIIEFFPKANKILIRKRNKWILNGLSWIESNLT